MPWIFAALAGIGFVEAMLRLPMFPALGHVRQIVSQVQRVIRSKHISDHWKEKILPRYAFRVFRSTLVIGACLLAAFIPFFLLYLLSLMLEIAFLDLTLSWIGIAYVTIVAIAYAKLRSFHAGQ